MKKKLLIVFAVIFCITLTGCSSELPEENSQSGNNAEVNSQTKVSPVKVYEDSKVKVTYTGINEEESSLVFEVENKSNQNITFAFDSILINGETETPASSTEIMANSKNKALCDVSNTNIDTLTSKMYIADSDGYEIENFSVKDVKIK